MSETRDADVVVIGAGPGGLATAAILARTGRRVVVVDARDVAGGHMSAVTRQGYEFDIGLHYTSAEAVHRVLRPLGVPVTFGEFEPDGMVDLKLPDIDFMVPKGIDAFAARLHDSFPDERAVVDTYLSTVRELRAEIDLLSERHQLRELPRLPWQLHSLLRHSRSTVGGFLDGLGASGRLQAVLTSWVGGSFALPPSRTSLAMHAAVVTGYLHGMSYPHGGSSVISEGLVEVIRRHGGELLLGTEVSRIVVDTAHRRVRGVRVRPSSLDLPARPTDDILAPVVVSAVDLTRTCLELLGPEALPGRWIRRAQGFDLPLPLFIDYLVLDRDLRAEGFRNRSIVVSETDETEGPFRAQRAGELPMSALGFVWIGSLADPVNPRLCRPGQTNLQIITTAPASHDFWGVAPGRGPTTRYLDRKRQLRDRLIALGERAIPGLAESVVFEETASPITDERFMRTTGGTSYGIAATPRQTLLGRPGPATPIHGLFIAGASARSGHGLVGTLYGGLAAASAITATPGHELLGTAPEQPAPVAVA